MPNIGVVLKGCAANRRGVARFGSRAELYLLNVMTAIAIAFESLAGS
jgi:hypothetical protein